MVNICSCGGNSKLIIDSYVINTRIPGYRQIVLKNVRHRQCKICGQMELTEDSKKMVDSLRDHYLNQYYDENKYHNEVQNEESSSNLVKDIIKLFRS